MDKSTVLLSSKLFWTRLLCTVYPFGLNDNVKNFGKVSSKANRSNGFIPCFGVTVRKRKRPHGIRKHKKKNIPNEELTKSQMYMKADCADDQGKEDLYISHYLAVHEMRYYY